MLKILFGDFTVVFVYNIKLQWDLLKISCSSSRHDCVTLKRDYDNLLIDTWTLDHRLSTSVMHWQKPYMEAWHKLIFTDRTHAHAAKVMQAATGLTSSEANMYIRLFILLSISWLFYTLSFGHGNKGQQPPPQNTHQYFIWISNITPQLLSDLMTRGSLINSRTLFQVYVVDIE